MAKMDYKRLWEYFYGKICAMTEDEKIMEQVEEEGLSLETLEWVRDEMMIDKACEGVLSESEQKRKPKSKLRVVKGE